MAEMTRIRMSAEDYLALPETPERMELIEGEAVVSPSPIDIHQQRVFAVSLFLHQTAPHGFMRLSPMDVHLGGDTVLQPDVFWVRPDNPNCQVVNGTYWHGAPDLVVEILSPSTAQRDYGKKFELYERYGVREYWLMDVIAQFVQVYTNENGKFMRQGAFGVGDTFMSPVLEITVEVRRLFSIDETS